MGDNTFFSNYFDQMDEMVFLIEYKDGKLLYANLNNAAKNLFGEGFIGKKFEDVLSASSYQRFSEYYLDCIRRKERVVFTGLNPFLLNKPSSETIITPIIKKDGTCSEAIGITKNIESLREQQEDYLFMKSFLDSTSDAILIIGTDNKVVRANQAFTEMFEWTNEELYGKHWNEIDLIPDEEKKGVSQIKHSLRKFINIPVIETKRLTKSKKEVSVSISYSPLTNEKRELVAYSMIYRDMTNIISLETQLEWSNEHYKSLFENNSLGVFMLNPEGVIEKMNPACEKISGYSEGESLGFNFQHVLSKAKDHDIIKNRTITDFQLKIEHKLGHIVHLECKTVPIIIDQQYRGTYVIAEDVTKKLRAEEMLQKSLQDLQNMKAALDASANVTITDTKGIITYVNDKFSEMSGYAPDEIIGRTHRIVNSNYHSKSFFEDIWETISSGNVWKGEIRNVRKDGTYYWGDTTIVPLFDVDGSITQYVAIRFDITAKKQISEALMQSEKQYRLITENSQDLIKVVNTNKKVTYASPSFTHVLGIPHENMVGESMLFGVWEEDIHILDECHKKLLATREPTSMEFRYSNNLGEPVWVEVKVTPIVQEEKIVSFISTGRVITERKQFEDKLWHNANHDSLTGLPNRRMLENVFNESLEHASDDDIMAILFLDCDKFKQINDAYGHDVGDELLIEIGKRLKTEIRENDMAARLGGDEFVVLLRNIQSKEHIELVANRLMAALREPYVLINHTLHVTLSIGISLYPQHGKSAKELLLQADELLYKVKKEGSNGFLIAK
ncbi:PAS domain S-box protein [Bacillus sp. FJAT-45066]|uniref:PAS domain S-box protein n=1 Tax=Bacillus sp. FJAT-45066 TaxID=2011010 RepID=UPI000BB7C01E|nr:PAS domain S-box protein [Bacillus sp. FJAT-45066]